MGGSYSTYGDITWGEKSEGKRPIGRPTRRREDNIRMDLKEISLKIVDSIHVAQDKDHWRALVKNNEPLVSLKSGEFLD
jgi:hypothetical protein